MFCAPTLTEVPDRISFTSRTAVNGGMTKRWTSAERLLSAAFNASAKTRASASVLFIFQLVPIQNLVMLNCLSISLCAVVSDGQCNTRLFKIGQYSPVGGGIGYNRVE